VLITDSQVHIWAANTPERPWPDGGEARAQRPVPLAVEELIAEMDAAGVDRAVIVPPSWEGDRNDVALAAAAAHPDRLAVMGRLDIADPTPELLRTWREQPGMLGVRLTFFLNDALRDGTADWFWPAAADAGVPVMVLAPGQTELLGEVAARYPDVRLAIDHLNLGGGVRNAQIGPALEPILALAPHANVAVKLSALPCLVDEEFPFPSLREPIRRVVETFGPERVMWGSDLSRLPCPYRDWVRTVTEACDFLDAADIEWIMGRAIAEWLDWPPQD
jgi:predicted TIM-barrel fold metal-dependent hydrolase